MLWRASTLKRLRPGSESVRVSGRFFSSSVHGIAATGFTRGAEKYEATRPSYPPEAVQRVLDIARLDSRSGRKRVLDLAAGTGKFTRLLAESKHLEVMALEPVENMRKVFARVLPPTVPVLEGSASDIACPDDFFDAVTVAQAFHWFDNIESLREIHRVLKPGGALVLLWNMEDKRAQWVSELRDAYERYDGAAPQYRKNMWQKVFNLSPPLFTPLQTAYVHHAMHVSKREVWERVLSKSYIAALPPDEQQRLRGVVDSILARHDVEFCHAPEAGRNDGPMALQPIETEIAWAFAL